MGLYRRTINTLGGPGQSIPDYGAQEAQAARELQFRIAQALLREPRSWPRKSGAIGGRT